MGNITVNVSGLGGRVSVELPDGSTVADAREAAGISDGLQVRCAGHPVGDGEGLSNGQQLVTAPPAAKHGVIA